MSPWLAFCVGYYTGVFALVLACTVGDMIRKNSARYPRIIK